MAEPTVSAGLARLLMHLAISKGADPAELARHAGLDAASLADQDRRIGLTRYMALMRAAQTLCQDPALALHFGESADLSDISVVGLICQAAETMGDAFAQLNRYGRLVVEVQTDDPGGRFQHRVVDGRLWLIDTRRDPNDFPELTESTFARMVAGTRRFGDTPMVWQVHVTHPRPAYDAEYDRIFAAPTLFDAAWNAMEIDPSWVDRKVALVPRYAFGILCGHAETRLRALEQAKTLSGQVEALLLPVLHTGTARMAWAAARLHMSRQTLFRKLRDEGTSFEALLDGMRRRLAVQYLTGGNVSVNETAYLVGFSEPAAFSRAFRRWTGTSPSEATQEWRRVAGTPSSAMPRIGLLDPLDAGAPCPHLSETGLRQS